MIGYCLITCRSYVSHSAPYVRVKCDTNIFRTLERRKSGNQTDDGALAFTALYHGVVVNRIRSRVGACSAIIAGRVVSW